VSVSSPVAGATVAGTINLAANADDSVGVTGVKWYVDGVQVASDYGGAPWEKAWNSATVADGTHKVSAKARDAAGNWGASITLSFTVDNTTASADPDTTVTSGPTTPTDPTPDFAFSSDMAGSTFECKVDGGAFEPCSSPTTLPTQADGQHVFYVRAVNGGRTDPTPASHTFTVDTTKPKVSVSSPVAGATVAGTINLAANADDSVGVTGVKWYVDGVQVASDYGGAPWEKAWNSTTVADGTHKVSAKARDAAGNWGASTTITITTSNGSG
jgi:hypothetical protein